MIKSQSYKRNFVNDHTKNGRTTKNDNNKRLRITSMLKAQHIPWSVGIALKIFEQLMSVSFQWQLFRIDLGLTGFISEWRRVANF